MKYLFFSVTMFSAVLASAALAAEKAPEKDLIERAETGNSWEQLHLGMWYESHHHYEEAAKWFDKSAAQGNIAAEEHLGLLYAEGQGVPKDYAEAVRWLLRSAEGGNILAQDKLGEFYQSGTGLPNDYVQAYMWSEIAASEHYQPAITRRSDLEKFLTPQEVEKAQRQAREWMQQHPEPKVTY